MRESLLTSCSNGITCPYCCKSVTRTEPIRVLCQIKILCPHCNRRFKIFEVKDGEVYSLPCSIDGKNLIDCLHYEQ